MGCALGMVSRGLSRAVGGVFVGAVVEVLRLGCCVPEAQQKA